MNSNSTLIRALAFVTLAIILIAGLHPKDFKLTQSIASHPGTGLSGASYTLAATEKFLPASLVAKLNTKGFVIDMDLVLPEQSPDYFMAAATITTGDDADQFLIGQWRDTLIIMMGNDYANKSRQPAVYLKPGQQPGHSLAPSFNLKLSFTTEGARAFYNGKQIASNTKFLGQLPGDQAKRAFITLANAANREHGWPGKLARFELFESETAQGASVVRYDFTENPPTTQSNLDNAEIKLLPNYQVRKPELLNRSFKYFSKGRGSLTDLSLNIVAFIPLGLFCCLLLYKRAGLLRPFLLACAAGSSLSLMIEIVQSLVPSRHSTAFDLFFNSTGTLIGALLALLILSLRTGVYNEPESGTQGRLQGPN